MGRDRVINDYMLLDMIVCIEKDFLTYITPDKEEK